MLGSAIIGLYRNRKELAPLLAPRDTTGNEKSDKFGHRILVYKADPDQAMTIVDEHVPGVQLVPTYAEIREKLDDGDIPSEYVVNLTPDLLDAQAQLMLDDPSALSGSDRTALTSAVESGNPTHMESRLVVRLVVRTALDTGHVKDRYRRRRALEGVASSSAKQQDEGSKGEPSSGQGAGQGKGLNPIFQAPQGKR